MMLLNIGLLFLQPAKAETPCNLRLMVKADKGSTEIWSSPKGGLLFTLPVATYKNHTIEVIDQQSDWWRISSIGHELSPSMTLEEGWIRMSDTESGFGDGEYGPGSSLLTTPIYSAASYAKKSGFLMHPKATIKLLSCKGPWLQINHQHNDITTIGWWAPEDQCPNSVTNCHKENKGELTGEDSNGYR